jgi:hypothetical protein
MRIENGTVGGRMIDENGPRDCDKCKGQRGWSIKNGVVTHVACNTKQERRC